MQIDAIQIIARFLGRDGETRRIDHIANISCSDHETARHITGGNRREILDRQGGQAKIRPAGTDHCMPVRHGNFHLGAFGQLAGNVIEQMRRYRSRSSGANRAFDLRGNIHIHVGSGHQQHATFGLQHDICQNGNGVATLDDRLYLTKRSQKA